MNISSKLKKNIAYILYNERPNSGIIQKQVIDLLLAISENKNIKITIVCFWNPIVYFNNYKKIGDLKKILTKKSIKIKNYPIVILPNRLFFKNKFLLKILINYMYFFFKILNLEKFNIVHGRSYFPSYIATLINTKKKFNVIFDMRSLLPEESISLNYWKKDSAIFNFWKKIEKDTIACSEYIITVSNNMKKQVLKINPDKNIVNIDLIGASNKINYDLDIRNKIRKKLNLIDKTVFLYVGSLDEDTNNNVKNYINFLNQFKEWNNTIKFLFVVPKIKNFHYKFFHNLDISSDNIIFIEGLDKNIFFAADVGISILKKTHDSDTRFGIKIAEYLSHGLPVIIKNVGGAEEIVKKINAGLILEYNQIEIDSIKNFLKTKFDRKKIIDDAEFYFSLNSVVKKYTNIYLE